MPRTMARREKQVLVDEFSHLPFCLYRAKCRQVSYCADYRERQAGQQNVKERKWAHSISQEGVSHGLSCKTERVRRNKAGQERWQVVLDNLNGVIHCAKS